MIFRYLLLSASALIFGLAFSNEVVAQMDFSFPDEKVPVLKVEEYYNEANKDKRPMLLVYSDGRVVRPVSVLETEDYKFTLSKEKFKDVLAEIFDENDFATLSDDKILAEVSSPRRAMRAPRNSFRVTLNTGEDSHVVSFGDTWLYDRLGQGRKRYPDAKQLQRFLEVEEVCRELSKLALIGGEEAFQDTVKKVNEKFKQAYPDGPAISDKDLFSVRRSGDGKVAVRFRVNKKVVEPHPVSVWVTTNKGEAEPSIEIKVDKGILMRDVPSKRPPIKMAPSKRPPIKKAPIKRPPIQGVS